MKKNLPFFLALYGVVGFLEIASIVAEKELLRQGFKILCIPLLALYFWNATAGVDVRHRRNGLLALGFSYAGDLFLLPTETPFGLFLAGLLSFLIAHLVYIRLFTDFVAVRGGYVWKRPLWLVVAASYYAIVLWTLLPGIETGLRIPVVMYGMTICSMALAALNTFEEKRALASQLLLAGAILFVLSDTLLAIRTFIPANGQSAVLKAAVMATYLSGQFLLVQGLRLRLTSKSN